MNKGNKILLALLMLQVTLLMGMRLKGSNDDQNKRVNVELLPGVDPETVSAIHIWGPPQKGDGPTQNSVSLAKVNGTWGVADADQYPVNEESLNEVIKKLANLTSRTKVLTGSTYHEKLEVSADTYQRKVTIKADGKEHTLYFGTAPKFKSTHVRIDGQDAVYLVNEFGNNDLGDRAWGWVDRKYHEIPDNEVWQVSLKNAKGELRFERDPATSQWAAVGVEGEVDTNVVNDLIRKSRSVSLEAPLGKGEKSDQGFAQPQALVTLATGTSTIAGMPPASTKTVTLKVGGSAGAKKGYFVKSSQSDHVARVAEWAVKPLLEKGPADLIKKAE